MKTSKKRKYTDAFILQRAEFYWNKNKKTIQMKNKESSETHTPKQASLRDAQKIESDLSSDRKALVQLAARTQSNQTQLTTCNT